MRIAMMLPLVTAVGLLGGGCLAWVVPEYAPPAPMVDGSSPSDLAPAASSSDAGASDAAVALGFRAVQAGLEQKGCTTGACHGGVQTPVVKAAPASEAERMANYTAFTGGCAQGKCVDMVNPDQSLTLAKPLATSALTHVGGKLFADFNDPVYVTWLRWIKAGAPY